MATAVIKSSFIASIAHNDCKLTVYFKKGSRRRYIGVPFSDFLKMAMSKKPGTYYTDNIKGKYKSKLLNQNQA